MAKEKKPVVADADDLATLQAKHEALLEEVDTLARNMARLEAENADLREKVKELSGSVRNSALIDPPAPPPPGKPVVEIEGQKMQFKMGRFKLPGITKIFEAAEVARDEAMLTEIFTKYPNLFTPVAG